MEVVEDGSGKNGSDSDETGRHPSGVNQIGSDKSDVMNSVCVNHPDVLVA